MNYSQKPLARKKGLVIQEMPDEVLVYDSQTNKGFCLNQTAAFVWKNCTGKNSVSDIIKNFENESGNTVENDLIWLAIDQLSERNLLETNLPALFAGESRRSVLKKIGFASMVVVPVIASLAGEAKSFNKMPAGSAELSGAVLNNTDTTAVTFSAPPTLIVPCSDRLTPLRAGANVMSFIVPTIIHPHFYAYLTTAATSGQFAVDLKRNGISILSENITIDAGKKTSVAAAQHPVIVTANLDLGDEIVVDITNAADGTASGLMILVTSSGVPDTHPPTIPGGLTLIVKSPTQMTAEWAPAATN
jgi:hypothetical protein